MRFMFYRRWVKLLSTVDLGLAFKLKCRRPEVWRAYYDIDDNNDRDIGSQHKTNAKTSECFALSGLWSPDTERNSGFPIRAPELGLMSH
jgi:hypothetical protein